MPTTKRESIYFASMMCFGMVVVMTFYNLIMNGLLDTMTLKKGILQFVLTFFIALTIESVIVSPIAKKIVFSLPFDKTKKPLVILSISTCMVIGMVFFMSFYGLIIALLNHRFIADSYIKSYFLIFMKNFIFAFPLQLLVIGPIVRLIFVKFVRKSTPLKVA